MTKSDEPQPAEPDATGLLVLNTDQPDAAAFERLCAALDERGFRRGHLVGTVLAVTAPLDDVRILSGYVEAIQQGLEPSGADAALLRALAPVESFAWDEGAETF